MKHFKHAIFEAHFIFDDDKYGVKRYKGTPTQCLQKFNKDAANGVLPAVNYLLELKQVSI